MTTTCPFCNPQPPNTVLRNALCYARPDKYPVSPGHLLIVPYRHIPDLSEATPAEVADLLDLLGKCREYTDARHAPDGYNIGVNEGTAAGQTVMHLHIHLIPRYSGDMADPRGGVRGVIPEKRVYPSSQKRDTLSDQN